MTVAHRAPLTQLRELASAYAAHRPVRSVAVVGNAPLEPSDERADTIDGADLVIRMNSLVLDHTGQPRCQGRRTDVVLFSRLVIATRDLFDHYRDRLYLMLEPMRMYGRPEVWPRSWPADLGHVVVRNDEVMVPINEEIGLAWREEQLAPTTGTVGAWLAVNLFPEADVMLTGLSYLEDPEQLSWVHQFGDSVNVGPEHRIAAEAAMINGWIARGRARVLR